MQKGEALLIIISQLWNKCFAYIISFNPYYHSRKWRLLSLLSTLEIGTDAFRDLPKSPQLVACWALEPVFFIQRAQYSPVNSRLRAVVLKSRHLLCFYSLFPPFWISSFSSISFSCFLFFYFAPLTFFPLFLFPLSWAGSSLLAQHSMK